MATQVLLDAPARRTALMEHDRSLLVEAGAGSGKTAVLAGRIALMLMRGIEPKTVAAVTFTELAASELLFRVREFVTRMLVGDVPAELRLVLPEGLTDAERTVLVKAESAIDDIAFSTIHGFCQRLIRPYPVEANMDPGASIMDPEQGKLVFMDLVQGWLREQLDGDAVGLLAELMLADPTATLGLVDTVLRHQRENDDLRAPAVPNLGTLLEAFNAAAAAYVNFIETAGAHETETSECAAAFVSMTQSLTLLDVMRPAGLVSLVRSKATDSLCKADGDFKVFKKKGKWAEAAKQAGRSKAEGESLNLQAASRHDECCRTWRELLQGAAAKLLHELLSVLRPAVQEMEDYKRSAALLGFDDLLKSARNLLRSNLAVRTELADHYRHVLVDEFQDTDPVQTEIFWRLCGEPPAGSDGNDWRQYAIRPGALFLVGDPKQAIYRFRGADVSSYVWARDAFTAQDAASVISIRVNFRSCGPILEYVNQRFAAPLGLPGQPGFLALEAFHPPRQGGPCVSAFEVAAADAEGEASATEVRDAEAEAVARLCAYLIGNELITDPITRERRLCRAGDIALLAPTGADLWRYEQALEDRSIAVATQAGKGFFRRQEVQDLIALTRVLADARDTLAFGALLRGPIVGLRDEDILDIVWSMREEGEPKLPALSVRMDAERATHPLFKDVLKRLQALRKGARGTTPHNLLSQAVDELRVRPCIVQRCGRQAERALANVDLFLNFSRAYEVRGLEAFSQAMTVAWTDESRAVEGRPDAQEESAALYSMHAAKGLEWSVVIPINGMTTVKSANKDVVVRATNTLYCSVFGVVPPGHDAAMQAEKDELERERVRLWYVAATRARELLFVPRINVAARDSAWSAIVDLGLPALPAYPLPADVPALAATEDEQANSQTREVFATEATTVASTKREILWSAPSRDEDINKPLMQEEDTAVFVASATGETHDPGLPDAAIQGGRDRGLVLHKLLEEVLTGETADEAEALTARAAELGRELGLPLSDDPSKGLSPAEVAATTRRALSAEAVAAVRATLVPEFHAYAANQAGGKEYVLAGIVDAISYNADGTPAVVIDWKSDVEPTADALSHYKRQVRSYLDMTGAPRGLVVFATTGAVHEVSPSSA